MKNLLLIAASLFFVGNASFFALNGFSFKPDKVIRVRFERIPPIMKFAGDIGVYYRGLKVGKATCKNLSADQMSIIFCLEIDYKGLKLPQNTQIVLKTQDIFGDRYFDLIYPENPVPELLTDGDIINGTAVLERVDKYLVEQMSSGELGKLISNLNYLAGGTRKIIEGKKNEDLDKVSGEVSESVEDFSYIVKDLKELLADPQVQKDLKNAIAYAPKALKNINEFLASKELDNTVKQAPQLLDRTVSSLESVSESLEELESLKELHGLNNNVEGINSTLCGTNQQLGCFNAKIPVIPQELIVQTDTTLKRFDCLGDAFGKTVSKNCLFFRFLFGKPGEPFEKCVCP